MRRHNVLNIKQVLKTNLFIFGYLIISLCIIFIGCDTRATKIKAEKDIIVMSKNIEEKLDTLSRFPQGTLEKDLYYELHIEINPYHSEAWRSRSVAYNKRGVLDVGFDYLNKSVELDPKAHIGYRGFVKLYMLHDYFGALNDFKQFKKLHHPNVIPAWGEDIDKLIGLCYLLIGKIDSAIEHLESAIKREEIDWVENRTLLYLGISYIKLEKYTKAEQAFKTLLGKDNTYTEVYYYLALVYLKQKEYLEAEKLLKKCKFFYVKNGFETNPYFELPFQIYFPEIVILYNQLAGG